MGLKSLLSSNEWLVEEKSYNWEKINSYETIFTVGNGYQGTRGTYEEGLKGELTGTFLAGVFDNHDSSVTELVNAPNWLPLRIWVAGELLNLQSCKILEYHRVLDMRKGLLYRLTRFEDSKGRRTSYESIRFASFSNQHLCGIKATITPENYEETITVESIIDGGSYNLDRRPVYIPADQVFHPEIKWEKWAKSKHLDFVGGVMNEDAIYLETKTMNSELHLGYASNLKISGTEGKMECRKDYEKISQLYRFEAREGKTYSIEKLNTIYTSRDVLKEDIKSNCLSVLNNETDKSFDTLIKEHVAVWDRKWADSDCTIKGDPEANHAIRFNIYHLLICGNEHDHKVNIAAKSLSGEGYHGHVFWDTEIYILPFFIYTQPEIAKALVMYRYHTMLGALENASMNGFKGSQYAWESADTGQETTPKWTPDMQVRIWTGEEEIQITAVVAYGVLTYFTATGDFDFLLNYGAEILFNTARFWDSRLEYNEVKDHYELNRVIGPDEFHIHVNNNVYTNWMVRWNLRQAVELYNWLKKEHSSDFSKITDKLAMSDEEVEGWLKTVSKIYIPNSKDKKLVEQFEGYFQLKDVLITEYDKNNMPAFPDGYNNHNCDDVTLIKQPDVLMLMYILPGDFSDEVKQANYEYYEKRTMHKSSLSPAIHSIMGIETGDTTKAVQYFRRSAMVDLHDNQGNTQMGIHGASTGGTWMALVFGFGGFRVKNREMTFKPWLPEEWEELRYTLKWKGDDIKVNIQKDRGEFTLSSLDSNKTVDIVVFDKRYTLKSGEERIVYF